MLQTAVLHLVLVATTSVGFVLTQSDANAQASYSENDARQVDDAAGTPATLKDGVVRIGWAHDDAKARCTASTSGRDGTGVGRTASYQGRKQSG